jgi:hypothetical protein
VIDHEGQTGAASVVPLVTELVAFLRRDGLTIDDVAGRVGPIAAGTLSNQIALQSRLTGVRAAELLAYPDSGLPYMLSLEPDEAARPTLAAMKSALGDYRRMRSHFGEPRQASFSTARVPGAWHVVVLAEAEPTDDLESAPITRITFRRDPPANE